MIKAADTVSMKLGVGVAHINLLEAFDDLDLLGPFRGPFLSTQQGSKIILDNLGTLKKDSTEGRGGGSSK